MTTHGGKRKGAGRPPVYPHGRVTRSLSLDTRADRRIAAYAKEAGLTRSEAASRLILRD